MAVIEDRTFKRQDGKDKVTGAGRYTGDLELTGLTHCKFRYAGIASGRITRIDTSKAEALPGVFAVVTHADVPDVRYGEYIHDRRLFAKEYVHFEGDVIAGVAAVSAEVAQRACDLIEVDIEPMPVVNDVEASLEQGAPLVHPDWKTYADNYDIVRDGNDACHSSVVHGDIEAGFAAADHIVRERYVADMSHAAPIEPRAVVAEWHGDQVTIWSSTQVPFAARAGVAETLQLPQNGVRVIVTHLGGGFGGKCGFHFEAHVAAVARKAQRPTKLVFSRREEFLAPDHRREGMVIELESGVKNDGTITAKRGLLIIDNGAYTADAGFFPELACMHAIGPYAVPAVEMHAHLAYTNHQPSGSVRAPTAPQANWASESHMDELARTIGMDPVAFRLKNVVQSGGTTATGQTLDPHGAPDCISTAAELLGWGAELPEDEAMGIAIGWWPSFGSSSGAYIKFNGDGSATIVTGAQECGSGAVMALPRLAADQLGMRPEDFSIVYQDTESGPYDMGSSGSQTTFNNGRAVMKAAAELRERLLDMAAEKLEAAKGDLELAEGTVRVKGSPDKSVPIAELAGDATGGDQLLATGSGEPPSAPEVEGSACIGRMGMDSWVAPGFFCHAVHVKVDRETGVTRVLKVAAAHDSGTIINPVGAEGQIEGGVVMGIGQALLEGNQIGEDGKMLGAGLLEYKLQTMSDIPPIDIAFVGPPAVNAGPHGAKTIAEPPSVPTLAAIGNAIRSAAGVRVAQLPMTPNRVWDAMNA
ncbi:MAG: xanthine dehydrogenase family protein molybdopterin-binding subunit [Gaiellales bacterium]